METEEQKSLWNKKADEITVGDAMKLNAAVMGICLGSIVAVAGAAVVWDKAALKFRQIKLDRKAKKEQDKN